MANERNDFEALREAYYKLEIGMPNEAVWIKKLRNILRHDIHSMSLGCYIEDTHIKIGDLHLGAFFEAQLLFSHAKWVQRFSSWLNEKIGRQKTLIIGYETYIEPVLVNLKKLREKDIEYYIYEEPKYTQRNQISPERFRAFEVDLTTESLLGYKSIVFLCGISTSLSTYEKMREEFYRKEGSGVTAAVQYISIIQVLPMQKEGKEQKFQLRGASLTWNKEEKWVERTPEEASITPKIHCDYLVDADCEMHLARECKWCFPERIERERPLIRTEDVSVIPTQMIGSAGEKNVGLSCKRFDFFAKDKTGNFEFQPFLYYNHIDRGDHHFLYYVRTRALLQYLMAHHRGMFRNCCEKLSRRLSSVISSENINIIIAPLHFSNSRLPHEINRYVFNNTAHEISFDPKKEFRSNFESKYSNYAYALKQIPPSEGKKIHFFFVDDEIITGGTFHRAKSFAASLMRKYDKSGSGSGNYRIFAAVITLVDRLSDSTKYSYVSKSEEFYSFFHFFVPSIRNYGDSCPLCRQIVDARNVIGNCTLNSTAQYWQEKENYLQVKTLEQARKLKEKDDNRNNKAGTLSQRHFIRFYCENVMWKKTRGKWKEDEFFDVIVETIRRTLRRLNLEEQFEYLISFLKIISRPFLYYKENEKKAAMRILHRLLQDVLQYDPEKAQVIPYTLVQRMNSSTPSTERADNQTLTQEKYTYEMYSLLSVLITCLSNIGSNYLLSVERINELCEYVRKLDPKLLRFNRTTFIREERQGFYSIITNNFKNVISGISGAEKSNHVDEDLYCQLRSEKNGELYKVLYLENIQQSENAEKLGEQLSEVAQATARNHCVMEKYDAIGKMLFKDLSGVSLGFYMSPPTIVCADSGEEKISIPRELIHLSQDAPFISTTQLFLESGMADSTCKDELKKAENDLQQMGYYSYSNRLFWVVFQRRSQKSSKADQTENIFMRLLFQDDSIDNYKQVRKILIQRHKLFDIICMDLETGALDSAIKAKAAEHILRRDKIESHGQSHDIKRMLHMAYSLFESAKKEEKDSDMYKAKLCEAYGAINLFVNRCIAFGAAREIGHKYFQLDTRMSPFMANILFSKRSDGIISDLETYLSLVKDRTYICYVQKDIMHKRSDDGLTRTQQNEDPQLQISVRLDRLRYIPYFVKSDNEERDTALYLIGILDTFLRNAIEHSTGNCVVEISYQHGDDAVPAELREPNVTYSNSYSFTVKNTAPRESEDNESGLTRKFFTKILWDRRPEDDNYFAIRMEPLEDDAHFQYQARLICVVKDFEEVSSDIPL